MVKHLKAFYIKYHSICTLAFKRYWIILLEYVLTVWQFNILKLKFSINLAAWNVKHLFPQTNIYM